MTQRPTESAKYLPGRDANGLFAPGNKVRQGTTNETAGRLSEIKRSFLALVTDEQRAKLWESLYDLCMNCEVMDVRQKSLVYALDRIYGKPTERVEMDVDGVNQNVNVASFNLSPEQIAVASQLLKQIHGATQVDAKPLEG